MGHQKELVYKYNFRLDVYRMLTVQDSKDLGLQFFGDLDLFKICLWQAHKLPDKSVIILVPSGKIKNSPSFVRSFVLNWLTRTYEVL